MDFLLEGEILQHVDCGANVLDAEMDLPGAGEGDRRAHFANDGLGKLLAAFVQQVADPFEQGKALRNIAIGKAIEGRACCLHGEVDILSGPGGNPSESLLAGGIDDVDQLGIGAIDPLAVDEKARVSVQGKLRSSGVVAAFLQSAGRMVKVPWPLSRGLGQ